MSKKAYHNVQRRREVMLDRAREKYGERALLPGGDPDRDVIDYLINELAGVARYVDMIETRAFELNWPKRSRLLRILERVRDHGECDSIALVELRDDLLLAGATLGTPEFGYDFSEDDEPNDTAPMITPGGNAGEVL